MVLHLLRAAGSSASSSATPARCNCLSLAYCQKAGTAIEKPVRIWYAFSMGHFRRALDAHYHGYGAAVMAVLSAGVIAFRLAYGIWPGASYPSEVAYCGRHYERGDEHRARAGEPGDEVGQFTAPFSTTRSLLVVGGVAAHVGDSSTCTIAVYIRTGKSTVLQYNLEGGSG